jgi:hypothetical protein
MRVISLRKVEITAERYTQNYDFFLVNASMEELIKPSNGGLVVCLLAIIRLTKYNCSLVLSIVLPGFINSSSWFYRSVRLSLL